MQTVPHIIITGATHGIGQLAAIGLAVRGARLGLVARSPQKAELTRALIERAAPGTVVDVFLADFARLAEVRRVAAELDSRWERIDVLVNNAGLHAFEQRITPDGFAEMIAVNYLAPWLLTNALRAKLLASKPARVVTVASEASRHHGRLVIPEDLTNTTPFGWRGSSELYGKTKLLAIMFSAELARQLAGTGVTANALDPGFNATGLGRELPFAGILERLLTRLGIGDPRRGAGIIVRLANDLGLQDTSGQYFSVNSERPITPTAPANDVARQRELWDATAALLAGKSHR